MHKHTAPSTCISSNTALVLYSQSKIIKHEAPDDWYSIFCQAFPASLSKGNTLGLAEGGGWKTSYQILHPNQSIYDLQIEKPPEKEII
jgi:hypothetical protein